MRNKKGEMSDVTTPNVLGAIIAIIGLSLLLFGAYKLYKISESREIESAQTTINSIEAKISALPKNTNTTLSLQGVNSDNSWFLTSWSKDDLDSPEKCFYESCVCVCKSTSSGTKDSCQTDGICRVFEKIEKIKTINYGAERSTIQSPYGSPIETNIWKANISNKIPLPRQLTSLNIKNLVTPQEGTEITISHYTPDYLQHVKNEQ